jgi:hypothetical protein
MIDLRLTVGIPIQRNGRTHHGYTLSETVWLPKKKINRQKTLRVVFVGYNEYVIAVASFLAVTPPPGGG